MSLADCLKKANAGKEVFSKKEISEIYAIANKKIGKVSVGQAEIAAVQELLDQAISERQELSDMIREESGIPVADAGEHAAVDAVLKPEVKTEQLASAKSTSEPIEDFGEKIIGARKEYAAAYKDRMAEAKTMDTMAQPLSKSWPEPDYQKLVDSGYGKNIVGLVRSMRDEIPNKPGKEWKQKTWAKQVEMLRETADQLLNDKEFADKFISEMNKTEHLKLEDAINGRAELYAELGHEKSLKGIRISRSQYGVYNGVPYNPPKIIWEVTKDAKSTAFGNMPRTLGSGDTRQAAIDSFAKAYSTLDTSKEKSSKTKFEIYADRYAKAGDKGQYFIGKKVGRNVLHIKDGIDSVKEAREYIASNNEELTAILEKKKEIPNERYDTNNPRVGQDMRNGQDVTPQMFSDAFGFRGVQFGNYVEGARRQKDLNDAYDALMDLAAVLDITPKAISLNGELGLAFGARGTGGKNPHSAHYESGHVVINLTKGSGAGSLAHEWWHSLDNYFSRMSGKKDEYATDRRDVSLAARDSEYQFKDDGIRKEMINAFGSVVKAINGTAIKQRSGSLDARRTKEYWGTGIEMSARAFERYVISKLHDNGFANDYLANVVSEEYWNSAEALGIGEGGSYPYPTESELPSIRGGFDNFFQTIESKETDKGTALYSASARVIPEAKQLSAAQLTDIVDQSMAKLAHQPKIMILDSLTDHTGRADDAGRASGEVRNGTIYLYRDAIANGHDAVRTIWHELLHYGIRRFLTADEYIKSMNDLAMRDGYIRKLAKQWADSPEADASRRYAAKQYDLKHRVDAYAMARGVDEILATFSESIGANGTDYAKNDAFNATLRAVRNWMALLADKIGMKQVGEWIRGMDNKEAREYVHNMLGKLRRDDPASNDHWAFTADGAYMVAWHGSPHDHDKFDSSKIRTGEGVQAYGHGLYFAGNKDVAEWYKKNLTKGRASSILVDGQGINPDVIENQDTEISMAVGFLSAENNDIEKAIAYASDIGRNDIAETLGSGRITVKNGRLYQVELAPSEDEYLLWDRPLSEQSEKVKAALNGIGIDTTKQPTERKINGKYVSSPVELGKDFYSSISEKLAPEPIDDLKNGGWGSYTQTVNDKLANDKAASELLHAAGIRGIKYLDGSSRGKGDSNFNYVIFNDADVEITAKFSRAQSYPELSAALEQYEDTGELATVSDLANEVQRLIDEDIAPDSLQSAIEDYRQEFADDHNIYAGRGDMDAADERFVDAVRAALTAKQSRTTKPLSNPQTVESVAKATQALRNRWTGFRNIKIVQSVKEVPNDIYLRALRALKPIDQGTEGIYDPASKTVYLIADNLASPERAVWVAAHEVVGHGGIRMLGGDVAAALNHAAKNGFVAQLAKAIAADRKETYNKDEHVDEAIAELAAASITGNTDEILKRYKVNVPAGMRSNLMGMIRRVVDAIRKFFAQISKKTEAEVTDSDILGLLRQMKARVEGETQESGQGNAGLAMASTKGDRGISSEAFARMIVEELSAENDAIFQHQISNSKDLPSILGEIAKADYQGEHTHADERDESGADHRYVFTTNEGKSFEVFETDDGRVWINVLKLEPGGSGQDIYAAVANYAYNTGKVFIGDPAGLSKEAMFRRTSNMLSSALRFGTTRHLEAAKEQIDGDVDNLIEPLNWRGNDIDKVEAMIHTFVQTSLNRAPELKDYEFNFEMGRFTDGKGKPVTGEAMAEKVRGRKGIGEKTARRIVLLRTILQSKSQGIGQRNGILEQVLTWGASSTPDSLDNLFSRRMGATDDRGNSQNSAGAKPESQILRKGNARGIDSDTSLIDKVVSAPFKILQWDRLVAKPLDRLLEKTGEIIPETIKAGIVSNYGLPSEYTESKDDMRAREAAMNRKSHGLIEMLAGLNRAESRVAYYWMQEKPASDVEQKLMEQLPEVSRETLNTLKTLISDMGKEAVRLGQMSPEAYQRNNMAYLHRTYAKHVLAEEGKIGQFMRARATKIKGNQYKGRGIFDEVGMSSIGGDPTAWRKLQQGRADKSLKGEKLIRFERRDASTEAMEALPGMTGKPMGKLREVVYWPASTPVPQKFGDWVNSGTFEVRDTKGDKLVLWRDLTREERERLGELDEVRYAVAQTLQLMIHDIEVGRFLEWTAKEYGRVNPEGKEVAASESMLKAYHQDEWVQVPASNIPDTKTKKYGALAGMYVSGSIWNDIRQTAGGRIEPLGKTYAATLRFWKKSKTVWSPGVHMNNVMGNFVMADWHDMRAVDLADALRVWAMNDKPGYKELFERFQDSGALGGMFQSNEVMRDEIKQRLEEIKADLMGEQDAAKEMGTMAKVLQLVSLATVKPVKGYANVMAKAYQTEDEVFRLAMFLKAVRHGTPDIEAGRMARHAFLNYDINAPWIQAARQTALPFISFFYRAAPMMLDTAQNKPWKIAKLIGFAYLINALGYAMAGGDEDKDRNLLPDEKSGRLLGLVPKMIRMPWNNESDAPVFLDVRRWVPVGDIADMEMGAGMLPPWATPGGPLVSLIEAAMFNKSMFTKQDIVKETDTLSEEIEKRIDYLFKSMMPNIPLPNPINMQFGNVSINPFNLDQGSLQSYSWSGIEKAIDRKENKIGEVRTTLQAIVNAFGVKVGSYPHSNMKAAIGLGFKKNIAEMEGEANKALRNFAKLENPTTDQRAAKDREVERLRNKMKTEADRVREKLN